ncbi:MAG TPA: hypothetical protein VFB28_01920 [Terriglobales bacterium]|nr:hypothetical protein [Terriglobales bacterium]
MKRWAVVSVRVLLAACLCAAPASGAIPSGSRGGGSDAADQYVSPNGNDNWDGTSPTFTSGSHGPVADICTARDHVRKLVGSKPVVVMVEDGSQQKAIAAYYSTPSCPYPVSFTASDGGTSSNNTVTYRAVPGELPVFDGGMRVTGWKVSTSGLCSGISNCYSVSLSPSTTRYFEGLFYNGVRRFRPRMGAGLHFSIASANVSGTGNAAIATYTTTNNNSLQLASTVTVSGVSGGTGFNITCSISAVTSNSFSCDSPNASGHGRGGTVIVDNKGQYYRVANGCFSICSSFNYAAGDPVSAWSNITVSNAGKDNSPNDILVYSFQAWTVSVGRVNSINTGSQTITISGEIGRGPMLRAGFISNHRYVIDNVRDFFGQPGQWFLDRTTAPNWTLYYVLQPGDTNPNTDAVVIPQSPQSDLTGHSMTFAGLFTFDRTRYLNLGPGLTFRHDNTIIPAMGYTDVQDQPEMAGALLCNGCQQFTVTGDTFAETMGAAFILECHSAPCAEFTATGNAFYDIASNALLLNGDSRFGADEGQVPHHIDVENNYFAYGARLYPGASAVTSGLINNSTFAFNTIHDWYQKGIELCKPQCGGRNNNGLHDINIHDNVAWNIALGIEDDTAGIYLVDGLPSGAGVNNVVNHNLVHDVTDAGMSGLDRDGYGSQPIYLDDGSGGVVVKNNVAYRGRHNFSQTSGPNTNARCGSLSNCQNVFQNNISADGLTSLLGVQSCPPGEGDAPPRALLQFSAVSNIFYSRMTDPSFQIQRPSGYYFEGGNPQQFQFWSNNQYFNSKTDWTAGTPFHYASNDMFRNGRWHCLGPRAISWVEWSSRGIPGATGTEDSGSSISDPHFTHPYCTAATPAACVADRTQDDYSAKGTPGFSPIPPRGVAIPLSNWGVSSTFSVPTVIDTFPVLPLNPSTAFCPAGSCP